MSCFESYPILRTVNALSLSLSNVDQDLPQSLCGLLVSVRGGCRFRVLSANVEKGSIVSKPKLLLFDDRLCVFDGRDGTKHNRDRRTKQKAERDGTARDVSMSSVVFLDVICRCR